jgi:hypothetical protein
VSDQVSHSYKTTGKVIVLCNYWYPLFFYWSVRFPEHCRFSEEAAIFQKVAKILSGCYFLKECGCSLYHFQKFLPVWLVYPPLPRNLDTLLVETTLAKFAFSLFFSLVILKFKRWWIELLVL